MPKIDAENMGAGKYNDLCAFVRTMSRAEAAIIIIFSEAEGSGFSVQATNLRVNFMLPEMLRDLADKIEKSFNE